MSHYGTVLGGDSYFETRLRTHDWDTATEEDKLKSLYEATRIIDTLNFAGCKTDPDQLLQFPRDEETEVPNAVVQATYEIAIVLLGGYDPEHEANNDKISSQKYAGVSVTYKENAQPSVIPSTMAWRLLYPYLRDNSAVEISRVS